MMNGNELIFKALREINNWFFTEYVYKNLFDQLNFQIYQKIQVPENQMVG